MTRRSIAAIGAALVALAAACSSGSDSTASTVVGTTAATATTSTTTTVPATTSTTTTSTTSTTSTTTSTTTTVPKSDFLGEETIGYSVQGRPITVMHRGTPGGVPILVVGVIHGDENDGVPILDYLRTTPLPAGVDLYLMDALNVDGYANNVRGNANGVDLNRNFPHDWTAIAQPGDWEYSGSGPASEPETQAFIAFADRVKPQLTIWYHQDLNRISPSNGRDGPLRREYAHVTGLPLETVTGGTYTGVAATWVRTQVPDAMSFIVELGDTLPADQVPVHALAVLAVTSMVVNGEV